MSISQHIAGIRSRTGQNRSSLCEQVSGEQTQNPGASLERSIRSEEDDLSHRLSSSKIEGSENLEDPKTSSFASIEQINYDTDLDDNLQQTVVLERLEQRWLDLNTNLEATINHLQECSYQVTESSVACLDSLKGLVETTCDKVDGELKAFYHLMTKCDELVTKLSIASSFRDEVRTLRKSVETLEQLYKK